MQFPAPAGFIDDAVAFDDQRMAYVDADAAAKADLHVVTLATRQDAVIDVAPVTLHPIALRLFGARAFVVGANEDGSQIAALIELGRQEAGRGGLQARTGDDHHGHHTRRQAARRGPPRHPNKGRHESRRRDRSRSRPANASAPGISISMRPSRTSSSSFTSTIGPMACRARSGSRAARGTSKENQRTPDVEATYDLVTGKIIDRHAITDLFEQRKRYQALADAGGQLDFVRMAWDNSGVQIWRAGTPKSVALDQPITNYDPKSLQGIVDADGSAWFALKIDPVNPDAVARKKADPEYLDIFHATADGQATRKARILATGVRHRFGLVGPDRFWLLERSTASIAAARR